MTDKNVEKRISDAVNGLVPDVLDSVLSSAKAEKGRIYIMDNYKNKRIHRLRFAAGLVAALLLFTLGGGLIYSYSVNNAVASVVSLDVNPSIEITANKNERVIDVKALNGEGEILLADMDFSGSDIDVAINAIIGSMLRKGYINELANSILISVDSKDGQEAAKLRERLSQTVNDIISSNDIKGAVLSQTLTHSEDVMALAERYGITEGKAQLISDLLAADPTYDFETLARLSINELNLLTSSESRSFTSVSSTGSASDKAYIGGDAAIDRALKHLDLTRDDILSVESGLDVEKGVMVYEVEIHSNGCEHELEINALTGEVIHHEQEGHHSGHHSHNTDVPSEAPSVNEITLSASEAEDVALAHASVKRADAVFERTELDRDDGRVSYEIEFIADGYEYEYDVDANTGEVISYQREKKSGGSSKPATDGSSDSSQASSQTSEVKTLTKTEAEDIALAHAGLTRAEVRELESELDRDNGVTLYEIEFKQGGYEYSYDINASSGSILKYDKEFDD